MLNAQEIRSLEDRWKKYKSKQYFRYFIFIIFLLIIIVITVFLFKRNDMNTLLGYFNQDKQVSIKNNKITKKIVKNLMANKILSNEEKNDKSSISMATKEKNKTKLTKRRLNKTNIVAQKKNITNKNISKIINTKNKKRVKEKNTYELITLNTNFLNNIYAKDLNNTNGIKINEHLKNNVIKNIPKDKKVVKILKNRVQIKQKIFITSKKIDRIIYLKDRYYSSGKALYAILLSKEYYDRHKYKKSLKWAITSNNINSSNEDSWILFAKNKVKLGKKTDAIKALEAYLKSYSSKRVKILLSNIKKGVLK